MNKPQELLVEFDTNGNAKPLVMQWKGRGIRFCETMWFRRELQDSVLHHLFGVRDTDTLYTLDFNTGTNDWQVLKTQSMNQALV